MPRPTWNEYLFEIMDVVSKRTTCNRGESGAIIVRNNRILASGYAGAPAGLPHCDEVGHLMAEVKREGREATRHCVRTLHAEQNAILQAARFGISIEGTDMYTRMEPCIACAMFIVAVGIKRVFAQYVYQAAEEARTMLAAAGIELLVVNHSIRQYPHIDVCGEVGDTTAEIADFDSIQLAAYMRELKSRS